MKFLELTTTDDKQSIPRTYWNLYPLLLSILQDQFSGILEQKVKEINGTYQWFQMFERFLSALKLRLTNWTKIDRKRPSILQSLRILLKHKHYLQNRYRHNKTEENRLRLRSCNSIIKREFQAVRRKSWEDFISQVASPDPSTFWKTVKKLNKKKSAEFQGINDNNHIYRTSDEIVNCLAQHFTDRYAPTTTSTANQLDNQASDLWDLLTTAAPDDINLVMSQSDFKFNEQDIRNCIRMMKNKTSSSLDNVSNRMIKLIPANYHAPLSHAFNQLFMYAYWGEEWKRARVICLNKTDSPIPTTNQLRPISILPAFSKMYERLFLLRFNQWAIKTNIIPPQQSDATRHQSTTSRVNFLLEQFNKLN